jgi:hypothetical protein
MTHDDCRALLLDGIIPGYVPLHRCVSVFILDGLAFYFSMRSCKEADE